MKMFTLQFRSFVQLNKIAIVLLSLGFLGLHAQNSPADIIPSGSTVKKLSSNQYQFLEGPVWYNDSVLLFVDDGVAGTGSDIFKYDPVSKQFSKWPSNSTHCVGLTCDKDGNLIGTSSNIIMMNKAGQLIKALASEYNGKPFNNPNDLIADNKGGVYFTDPDFFVTTPPQDKTAVYYIDSTGNVKRVIDELVKPNGLVLSPDGTKLYVVETKNKYIYSWDVAPDGSVSGKLSLAELQTGVDSYADGMSVDIKGNIYVAGDKGIQVFSPQGAAIATIVVPERPSNCDFGGNDFKTLFITAHANLYSIELNYPGYAVSRALTTGIKQIQNKSLIGIYPNPVTNILHVKLNEGNVKEIEILNIVGKMESISLKKVEEMDTEINTQHLKPGIYFLKVVYKEGIVSGKFIKK